jgi:WD40 repeat protein
VVATSPGDKQTPVACGKRRTGVVNPDGTRLATGCGDNMAHFWDTNTFDEVAELRGHTSYVHSVAFSPVGAMLASS